MASVPVEVLVGTAFGLLIGIVPALTIGIVSFVVEYYTRYTVSSIAAVALALPMVGVSGYVTDVLSLSDPIVPRVVTAGFVGVVMSLLAASQGSSIARTIPRELHTAVRAERTLSGEAAGAVDGNGQIQITPSGEIRDLDGYPPLPPVLRESLAESAVRLPADLPLSELETRLESQLQSRYDLADVDVSIDGQGRASIAAAPPSKELSRQLPEGYRAISIDTLAPTGLSPGDTVAVETDGTSVSGPVLSIADSERTTQRSASVSDGGQCRVTVAVPTEAAGPLLHATDGQLVATAVGTTHELTAFSLLDELGRPIRQVVVGDGEYDRLETDDIELVALDDADGWCFDPSLEDLSPGQRAYVSGSTSSSALERYRPDIVTDGGVER